MEPKKISRLSTAMNGGRLGSSRPLTLTIPLHCFCVHFMTFFSCPLLVASLLFPTKQKESERIWISWNFLLERPWRSVCNIASPTLVHKSNTSVQIFFFIGITFGKTKLSHVWVCKSRGDKCTNAQFVLRLKNILKN